jgi:hypothetical protein
MRNRRPVRAAVWSIQSTSDSDLTYAMPTSTPKVRLIRHKSSMRRECRPVTKSATVAPSRRSLSIVHGAITRHCRWRGKATARDVPLSWEDMYPTPWFHLMVNAEQQLPVAKIGKMGGWTAFLDCWGRTELAKSVKSDTSPQDARPLQPIQFNRSIRRIPLPVPMALGCGVSFLEFSTRSLPAGIRRVADRELSRTEVIWRQGGCRTPTEPKSPAFLRPPPLPERQALG